MREEQRPLVAAGALLGIGLGGFLDGIVFHQILQLHNMLTGRIPKDTLAAVEINMFWDGLFHLFTWLVTAAGVWGLFRVAERGEPICRRSFAGALALGWGLFNLVEGTLDHHVLHLHHVVERLGVSAYDYAFLASGLLLIAVGGLAIRTARALPAVRVAPPRPS